MRRTPENRPEKPKLLELSHGTWFDLMEKVVDHFETTTDLMVRVVWHGEIYQVWRDGEIVPSNSDQKRGEHQRASIRGLKEAWKIVHTPKFREEARLRREIEAEHEHFQRKLGSLTLEDRLDLLRRANDLPTESPR